MTVGTDDYLRLVLKKTAWYSFIHPMRIGALVAEPDDQNLDRFDRFGFLLGLAFQITDDVLNLVGDVQSLRQGDRRRSVGGEADDRLDSRARSRRPSRPCMDRQAFWHGRVSGGCRAKCCDFTRSSNAAGSIDWAQESAATFAEAARASFDGAAPSPVCQKAPI